MSDKLVILGRYDCARTTHIITLISEIKTQIPTIPEVDIQTCFETEFHSKRDLLLKENKTFLKYPISPIIYLQSSNNSKRIIGSLEEFQNYIIETFMIHDTHKTEDFIKQTTENLKMFLETNGNKYVYFDIAFEGEEEQDDSTNKIIFELFANKCPTTADNFYKLCKGDSENGNGEKLSYINTIIHRVSKNSFIQGGDIRVKGCKCIYEKEFNDEHYDIKHDKAGILGMVKKGNRKHTNECQFYVTLCPLKSFDGKFVAFGRVIQGYEVIKKIGDAETYLQRPVKRIVVVKCGEYQVEEE